MKGDGKWTDIDIPHQLTYLLLSLAFSFYLFPSFNYFFPFLISKHSFFFLWLSSLTTFILFFLCGCLWWIFGQGVWIWRAWRRLGQFDCTNLLNWSKSLGRTVGHFTTFPWFSVGRRTSLPRAMASPWDLGPCISGSPSMWSVNLSLKTSYIRCLAQNFVIQNQFRIMKLDVTVVEILLWYTAHFNSILNTRSQQERKKINERKKMNGWRPLRECTQNIPTSNKCHL